MSVSAINLLNRENESALFRWELCGPEIGRIVGEFENTRSKSLLHSKEGKHHEDNAAFHSHFFQGRLNIVFCYHRKSISG